MTNWYNFMGDKDRAPSTEGVYLLGDTLQNVVYAGRADDIHNRLSEHPDPNNPCLWRKAIRYFAFEETHNSEEREQELIRYYNPKCNRTQ